MEKPWRVESPADNYEEDFATEKEALADAERVISLFREEAQDEGEWNDEVEQVRVYRLCHAAQITKRESDNSNGCVEAFGTVTDDKPYVDYGMSPVDVAEAVRG